MVKVILFVIMLFLLALVDPPLAAFIAIGLMPAFTAVMLDARPEKSTGRTVMFFNLAGLVKFLVPMLERFGMNKFPDALNIFHLFVVYAFAAMGYFVAWMVPRLFVIYADYKNQNRARAISEKLAGLMEEWGHEVRN
jgi:hypothetical protein